MEQTNLAIQASLSCNWKEAVKLNLQILKTNPEDVDALNRLAKAYLQLGEKTKAETTYKKALKIDKFNTISTKGLESIKSFRGSMTITSQPRILSTGFLEEPGTTKTISLTRLGDSKALIKLQPGDEVKLVAREHCVSVTTIDDHDYIGRLPDDLASKLRSFIKAGNTYQVWIKSVDILGKPQAKQLVKIFIKELHRAAKYRHTPSFPSTEKLTYAAFTPPELVHTEKPNILTPEEDIEESRFSDDKNESDAPESDNMSAPLPPEDD
jgi:tetratricopeptide (TPR) repeat protein